MGEVSKKEGRTILFVSHNIAAIQNLCTKGLLIESGQLMYEGLVNNTITNYLKSANQNEVFKLDERKDRTGTGAILFTGFEIKNGMGEQVNFLQSGGDFTIQIFFTNYTKLIKELKVGVGINNQFGERIGHLNNEMTEQVFKNITGTNVRVEIFLPKFPLKHGRYSMTLFASVNGDIADWVQDAFFIDVEQGNFYNTGNLLPDEQGNFLFDHKFYLQTIEYN